MVVHRHRQDALGLELEVYLSPKQLPRELMHGVNYWPWYPKDTKASKDPNDPTETIAGGGWLRLDPAPAGAGGEKQTWFSPVQRRLDWLQSAWSSYVVELNVERQRNAIYGPIAAAVAAAWRAATSAERWRTMYNSVAVA
ncbi:MAG: hypothetical protein ACLPIC_05680, partial [Rhodoblastus sp.]|uniref:hypothetical protein n=1 Tax=Rhodoblastus sp. TaxID=1962975 RepID=UPI003F982A1C